MKRWLSIILTVLLVMQPFAVSELAYAEDGTTVTPVPEATEPAVDGNEPAGESAEPTASEETNDATTEPETSEPATPAMEAGGENPESTPDAEESGSDEESTPPQMSLMAEDQEIQENILTDAKLITTKNVSSDEIVNIVTTETDILVKYDWKLPEGHKYQAGATFRFKLPDELKVYKAVVDAPLNFTNGSMGTFNVDLDGNAVVEFNDNITKYSDIKGTLQVQTSLRENVEISEENTVDVVLISKKVTKTLVVEVLGGKPLVKDGATNRVYNPEYVTWTIDVNRGLKTMPNARLTDVIPPEMKLRPGSLKIEQLDLSMDGTVVNRTDVTGSFTLGTPDFSIDFGELKNAYQITFKTDLIDDTKSTYTNTATLTYDTNQSVTASKPITATRGVELQKSSPTYDPVTQTIGWEAKINYRQKTLDSLDVEDFFNNSQDLISAKLIEITLDEDGKEVGAGEEVVGFSTTPAVESGKNGFTFTLPKNGTAYKLVYTTKSNGRVQDDATVVNEIRVDGLTKTASRDVSQVIIQKGYRNLDYRAETVEWSITLNQDNQVMKEIKVDDVFTNAGLDIIGDVTVEPIKIGDPNVQVTVTKTSDGFKLKFDEAINRPYIIRYKTAFDVTKRTDLTLQRINNEATVTWESESNESKQKTVTAGFNLPTYVKENGFKLGAYDATTKRISWQVGVNYNGNPTTDLKIEDRWQAGQNLDGAIVVEKMARTTNGTGFTALEVVDSSAYDVEQTTNGFILRFKNATSEPYLISYKTVIAEEFVKASYENVATATDEAGEVTAVKRVVTIPNGDTYTNKSGVQDDKYLKWTIGLNYGQSTLRDVVVTDTPSLDQDAILSTFKVYRTTVASNGAVTRASQMDKSEYEVTKDDETGAFTIVFNGVITTPLIVEYSSIILAKVGTQLSNEVELTAASLQTNTKTTVKSAAIKKTDGLGTASGETGSLEITKVGETSDILLEGAVFQLIDPDTDIVVREGTTDKDGLLRFTRLLYGEYELKEVTAPNGYRISVKSQSVTINATGMKIVVKNDKIRRDVVLTKYSGSDQSVKLKDATFALYKVAVAPETNDSLIGTYTTNEDGTLTVQNLLAGDYYFIETKSPKHHLLDATKRTFSIASDQIKTTEVEVSNQPFKSIQFTKVDWKDKNVLQGATFNLENENKETLRTDLVLKEDGTLLIEDLDLGTYRLVETKAPAGYILPKEAVTFEIKLESPALQKVNVENETAKSVKLTKLDQDTDAPLKGAVFQLLDSNNRVVRDNVTTGDDGTVTVTGLPIDTYTFVEKTAPAGYILDTTRHSFQVHYGQTNSAEVTVLNERQKSVRLIKTDIVTGKPLADAIFSLMDNAGNVLQSNLKTNAFGEILVTNLNPGSYRFVETSAPNGYMTDGTPYPFTLVRGTNATAEVRATNDSFKSVRLVKTDNLNLTRLAGAEFSLINSSGTIIREGLVTDSSGEIYVTGLVPGEYAFVETKAPTGYLLDTKRQPFNIAPRQNGATTLNVTNEQKKAVRLVKTDGTTGNRLAGATFTLQTTSGEIVKSGLVTDALGEIYVNDLLPGDYVFIETAAPNGYILDATPRPFSIKTGTNEVVTVSMTNDTLKSVRLFKTDSVDGTPLVGATFNLVDANGKVLKQELRTNVQGELIVDGLLPGTYAFIETAAPRGYLLDATPRPFTLVKDTAALVDVMMTNDTEKTIVLTKQDHQTDEPLAGATFVLKDGTGKIVRNKLVTDKDGRIVVDGLVPGDYTFVETKAPTGYQINTSTHKARVKTNQREATELVVTNERFKELIVEKVDAANGDRLAGAEFDLLDADGNRVARLKTDESGQANVTGLSNGTYTLNETKAPRGYLLDETKRTIRFTKGGVTSFRLVVKNTVDPEFEFENPPIPGGAGNPTPDDPDFEFENPDVPTGFGTPDQATTDKGKLPFLGSASSNGVWFGLALLVVGLAFIWSARRRRTN